MKKKKDIDPARLSTGNKTAPMQPLSWTTNQLTIDLSSIPPYRYPPPPPKPALRDYYTVTELIVHGTQVQSYTMN